MENTKISLRIHTATGKAQIWRAVDGNDYEYTWLMARQDKDGTKVWNAKTGTYIQMPQKRYRFRWAKHLQALQNDLTALGLF